MPWTGEAASRTLLSNHQCGVIAEGMRLDSNRQQAFTAATTDTSKLWSAIYFACLRLRS